jgi:hypothetical protein
MDTSDSVAVIALVVSLCALFVALLQLVQQLFITTEGYRRCAESVIGVWHRARKRRFVFWELRFETRYITPQLALLSAAEFKDAQEAGEEVYLLNSIELGNERYQLLKDTIHPDIHDVGVPFSIVNKLLGRIEKRQLDRNKTTAEESSLPLPKNKIGDDIEKAVIRLSKKLPVQRRPIRRSENELLVTWLQLLVEAHTLYASYWPKDCDYCDDLWGPINSTESKHTRSQLTWAPDKDNVSGTEVAIIYRRWNWEFMPSEIIRPLAEVYLGDILVLAIRMNIHWRALDIDSGRFQADGNGYSLSSTDVRNLGIVLKFSVTGSHRRFPRLIPSRAQDKMICGIVPGCPEFVDRDFEFISKGRKILPIEREDGPLAQIGIPRDRRKLYERYRWSETHNELIILLCPFLPLKDSTIVRFTFPAWGPQYLRSVFRVWEGREAITRSFDDRYQEVGSHPEYATVFEDISKHFNHLKTTHKDDFYLKKAILNKVGVERKQKLIDDCRIIFDYTTTALKGEAPGTRVKFHECENDGVQLRPYMHLVGAHVYMSMDAIHDVMQEIRSQSKRKEDRSQETLRKKYNVVSGGAYFLQELYLIGLSYAKYVTKPDNVIGEYLRRKGVEVSFAEAEIAWWLLMLRGLAWSMSTSWDGEQYGEPIPSSLYESKIPIWIT